MANRQSEQGRAKSTETPGAALHATAARGVAGGGGAMPFSERIQHSFGHHDIGGVRAHLGGAASEANAAMGSRGYATGSDVAFAGAPDLHTAAHEAAHVIQQRAGVHLAGGIGAAGDRYEQHADAVAELVVQGKSAESLLDRYAGGGATHAVQQRYVQYNGRSGGSAPATANATPASGHAGATRVDADGTRRQLNQHLGRIRNGLVGERERHRALDQLRYRSGVGSRMIGRISEGLGGAGRLPNQNIWQRVEDALTAADAALAEWHGGGGRDDAAMRRFQGHIRTAERHFRDNVAQMNLYQERVEEGNGQARETLTGVVGACAAAIVVAGATIGAAAGTAALATGATTGTVTTAMGAATTGAVVTNVTGAGILGGAVGTGLATGTTTAVFTGAERGGEMATGQRQAFDFGGLMRQAGTAAVTAFATHILGGALTRGFSAVFGRVVVARAVEGMPPTAREVIRARTAEFIVDFVRETAETMLTTALERAVSAHQGNPSQEGFLESVVQQMVRNGIIGMLQRRILGRLDASRAAATRPAAPTAATGADESPPASPASRRVDTRPGVRRPTAAADQQLPASTRGPGQVEEPRTRAPAHTPAADTATPAPRLGPGTPEPGRPRAPANTPDVDAAAPATRLGPGTPEPGRTRAPANTPDADTATPASRLGPGTPEPGRPRAPANTPAADAVAPATRLGPGTPEPGRPRAPANTPDADQQLPASTRGTGQAEEPRTRAPATTDSPDAPQRTASPEADVESPASRRAPEADGGTGAPRRQASRNDDVWLPEVEAAPGERLVLHGSTRRFAALMRIQQSGDYGTSGLGPDTVVAANGMTLAQLYQAYRGGRVTCTNGNINIAGAADLESGIRRRGWVDSDDRAREMGLPLGEGGTDGASYRPLNVQEGGAHSVSGDIDQRLSGPTDERQNLRRFVQDGVQGAESRPIRRERLAREQRMGSLEQRGEGQWVTRGNGQPATPEQLAQLRQDLPQSAQGTGALRGEALERYRAWVSDPANPTLDAQAWYRSVEQPRTRATATTE